MEKWHLEEKDGYTLVVNEGGATLGFSKDSGVHILEKDGYAFKDMDQNGELDPYEDWRLPVEERVKDLVGRMDLDSKLGLSLHGGMFMVLRLSERSLRSPALKARMALMKKTPEEMMALDPTEATEYHEELITHDEMRCWLMSAIEGPAYAAQFNNNIQKIAEGHKYGIPVWFSTNPRAFFDTHSDKEKDDVTCWPSNLGLGATFDPAVAKQQAETVSKEYRAMGITMELGPQVDLASDPRWNRMSATFGSDEQLNADMAKAICDGMQTSEGESAASNGWGRDSVLTMCKHWPGSTGEGGRESHSESGKYAVYPGGCFSKHTDPWTKGAFALDGPTRQCGAVMSCYDAMWGIGDEDGKCAGASFNPYLIDTLLREENKFEGFVCSDFWLTGSIKKERTTRPEINAWGYTDITPAERVLKEWESGVDQFGGANEIEIVRDAYNLAQEKHGKDWADKKVNEVAERVLTYGFRVGSFENPYADPENARKVVNNQEYQDLAMDAHRKSIVMLKNTGLLPMAAQTRVWVADKYHGGVPNRAGILEPITKGQPISTEEIEKYFQAAASPEEADCAVVFMDSPDSGNGYNEKTGEYQPISLQYRPYTAVNAREESIAGDLVDGVRENHSYRGKTVETYNAYDLDNLMETRKLMGDKPVILVLNCKNPVVPTEFEPYVDAILVAFAGTPNQVLLEAMAGRFEPSGLLPFQMPESMSTVEEHYEDMPQDMVPYLDAAEHSWDFGFGMNWNGVILDERMQKYRKRSLARRERMGNMRPNKPLLSDLSKITEDMMGPGKSRDYSIYVDPHVTPDFVKESKHRTLPKFPIIYEIGDHTYQINEFGMVNIYVLVGEKRGLVIDSGCGSFDARELISHLCPMPYDVAITHAHGDHCGGICQFDQVWMFPQDIPLVHNTFRVNQQLWENPNIWRNFPPSYPDGTRMNFPGCDSGGWNYYDYTNLTFMGVQEENLPEILELKEGQVFDLGNREVTVINIPGHTRGSAVFIDPKTRIAFTGDAFNSSFVLEGNSAALNLRLLKKLRSYRKDFDRMYPGHTAVGYSTVNFSQSPELLDDVIGAYQSLVDGNPVIEERKVFGGLRKMAVYGKAAVDV